MEEKSDTDWRVDHKSMADQLWYMYLNEIGTDTKVLVNPGLPNEMVYKTHHLILTRLSEQFRIKINQDTTPSTLTIRTFEPEQFATVLKFGYTEKAEFSSVEEAVDIFRFCRGNGVLNLAELCEQYVSENINPESVWTVLNRHYGLSKFMKTCAKSFLGIHTELCLKSSNFLSCTNVALQELLAFSWWSLDSEVDVIVALTRWAKFNIKELHEGDPMSPPPEVNDYDILGHCLEHIRFLSLTPAEFSEHVVKPGLLMTKDECLAVLVNLASPGQVPLPDWICRTTTPREKTWKTPSGGVPEDQSWKEYLGNENAEAAGTSQVKTGNSRIVAHVIPEYRKTEKDLFVIKNFPGENTPFFKVISAPFDLTTGFLLNKDALLLGVEMATQAKGSKLDPDTYRESLHVAVYNERKQVAYHSYHGKATYDEILRIQFTKPGRLKAGVFYSMKFIVRSVGDFELFLKKRVVKGHGVQVTFGDGKKTSTDNANLISGLVLRTAD